MYKKHKVHYDLPVGKTPDRQLKHLLLLFFFVINEPSMAYFHTGDTRRLVTDAVRETCVCRQFIFTAKIIKAILAYNTKLSYIQQTQQDRSTWCPVLALRE